MGDDDIARSITLTGQEVIKHANTVIRAFTVDNCKSRGIDITGWDPITYNDTDSFFADTKIITRTGTLSVETLWNQNGGANTTASSFGHEIQPVKNLEVLSYNTGNASVELMPVRNLMRHRVSKRQYQINVGDHSIRMTADHGCIVIRDRKFVRLASSSIVPGDVMMIRTGGIFHYELVKVESVQRLPDFQDEYVYDLEMCDQEQPWFFANDILVHNSAYISLRKVAEARGIQQTLDGKTVTPEYYALVQETEDHLNAGIKVWGETELGSSDCRLVFKREVIADAGLFLEKKRYILHILDKEGIPCDQFKYTGVEVARTTMPKALKPRVKSIIETMLRTQNKDKTNAVLAETYKVFVNLPIEDIASVMGISQYDKYANQSSGFSTALRTPIHVKAAYYYNTLLDRYGLAGKYEKIGAGDKIRFFYVAQPNKFGLTVLGYKYQLPPEFKADFRVFYDKMFEKIVFSAISRCYNAVNWDIRLPSMTPQVDLFDLLKED